MKQIKLNEEISTMKCAECPEDVVMFNYNMICVSKKTIKKVEENLIDFEKEIPLTRKGEINWNKIKSRTPFTATINNTFVTGKIQKQDGYIYLCQDRIRGCSCVDKLGYKHSWLIEDGSLIDLRCNHTVIYAFKKTRRRKQYIFFSNIKIHGFVLNIFQGHIKVGCQSIPNYKVRELANTIK